MAKMPKYFGDEALEEMQAVLKKIYAEREAIHRKYGVNLLDNDALSSLTIYDIVKQYDSDYNINFARNGEDAKSNDILVEQKTTQVDNNPFTKKGNPRKSVGGKVSWAFHVGGDLDHARYIFVVRSKLDLSILRIYDISSVDNRKVVLDALEEKRTAWHQRGFQKNDIIAVSEKTILENCNFSKKFTFNNCKVFKD
jgi:hypothetical protein